MNVKEYLQQIKKIDTLIKNKTVEIKQADEIGVETADLKNERQRLSDARQGIINDIQKLSEAHYDVLHQVYVQGRTFYEVAAARQISYSNATKIHGWALKALERIINAK